MPAKSAGLPPAIAEPTSAEGRAEDRGLDAERLDLESMYRSHARSVARWVVLVGGRGLDVEDLMQEVFIVAGQQAQSFRGDAKVGTWLFQITWRVVQNARRKARWRRFLPWDELGDTTAGVGPGPFETLEQKQRLEAVQSLLQGLREQHRAALLLFELEGKNLDELAEMFGVHRNTIAVWIHRARSKVLSELAEQKAKVRP